MAVALIRPLAWELPYAMGTALKKEKKFLVVTQQLTNPTCVHVDASSILGLAQWVKDLVWLWLWCRPAATTLVQPLA